MTQPTPDRSPEDTRKSDNWGDHDSALLEFAWGIIANAGGGDWTRETEEWQDAAQRWRDKYHRRIGARRQPEQPISGRPSAEPGQP